MNNVKSQKNVCDCFQKSDKKGQNKRFVEQINIEQKLVSIIIPIYNLETRIKSCLESVISQTYRLLEIILVDDGSTDNSLDICQDYAKLDSRIQVVHQNNRGVSAARNLGLKKATGKYVTFIDGDDTVTSNYIETFLFYAETIGADVMIGGYTKKEISQESITKPAKGAYSTKEFFSLLCKEGTEIYGYVWSKLFRLSLIKNNHILFNEKMSSQEDLDFVLSVYGKARKICCFDYCGYCYNYVPTTRKASADQILGNQIKLYNIAESADITTEAMLLRFQSLLYTWLYHATSIQEINTIIDLDIPDGLLADVKGQRWEVHKIIQLFRAKKASLLYGYFSLRGIFRSMLVRLHLIKPL